MTLNDHWLELALTGVAAIIGWFIRLILGRISTIEQKAVTMDARLYVVEQFTRDIAGRLDRIELKLDRLLERSHQLGQSS